MPIEEIDSTFSEIYNWIDSQEGLDGLKTTRGVAFNVIAKTAKDGRRFLSLPHGNRVYEGDWGSQCNSMNSGGQWIGQYCLPIHMKFRSC